MGKFALLLFVFVPITLVSQNQGRQYVSYGEYLYKKGYKDSAFVKFEDATKIDPKYYKSYFNLGKYYLDKKDYFSADKYFNQAVELDTLNSDLNTYYYRAINYRDSNRFIKAKSDLDFILSKNQHFSNSLAIRGQINASLKNLQAAEKDYVLYMKKVPDDKYVLMNLTLIYLNQNKIEDALFIVNKLLTSGHDDSLALTLRAYLKASKRQYKNSLDDLNRALKIDSKYALAYLHRARVYYLIHEKNNACLDFKKAHSLNVKNNLFYRSGEISQKIKAYCY